MCINAWVDDCIENFLFCVVGRLVTGVGHYFVF